ncbi:DEAD/DEAH box helicase [Bifidobacterium favimelis]|uniref:DEAD/DEAH box helicase n=1 Tax=Bifidobacterium favimelis TaxID=3122979 RepID=A0ABU8ZN59_9BIFI
MSSHQRVNRVDEDREPDPAQRYADFRRRRRRLVGASGRFEAEQPFALDDFQKEAIEALEDGENVLVAAPTGAGKTIVADFAVFLAQEQNVKAFYTTPIKALSNQKYHDLVDRYGEDRVGLLTGDTSINSEADIVVMTTEVLRNMLYEHSTTLTALKYVILDEVHYLADRFRGPVWEEVIIHLPASARIVGLSATVSNVEDFSSWISSVRGATRLVVSEDRPVPLEQHVLVQADRRTEPEIIDLYRHDGSGRQTSRINPALTSRLDQLTRQHERAQEEGRKGGHRHGRKGADRDRRRQGERYRPSREAVVDELDFMDMLPGIYFIFSRNGCDQAVQQCMRAGLQLTTDEEARRIRRIVDSMVEGQLSREDLKALGFAQFRFALEEGFAAHHAGVITLFRQIVEHLFELGLIKVVFATETLALGINMPARCVVVEKLDKFDGTGHVALTPGEFTQLTGRAGRRGIDDIGHVVVVDHRDFSPQIMAALSSKRVYPLHSSFRPTFNMAVNLLNSSDYDTARTTLDHSFAQWEANESASELEERIRTLTQALEGYEEAAKCSRGDFIEFVRIRAALSTAQKNGRRELERRRYSGEQERAQAYARLDAHIEELKERERHHPCRQCPDLAKHMKWGHRWVREERELERVQARYDSRTGSVSRQFDRICTILTRLGYIRRVGGKDYRLTDQGQLLRGIYSEQDLTLAQILVKGILNDLEPEELAAAMSGMIYEARRGMGGEPRYLPGGPSGPLARSISAMEAQWGRVAQECDEAGLMVPDELDFGLANVIYDWACGDSLAAVLNDTELTAGDFVRNAKRLSDVLTQIVQVEAYLGEEGPALARKARIAADQVNRGIVAYTGVE